MAETVQDLSEILRDLTGHVALTLRQDGTWVAESGHNDTADGATPAQALSMLAEQCLRYERNNVSRAAELQATHAENANRLAAALQEPF